MTSVSADLQRWQSIQESVLVVTHVVPTDIAALSRVDCKTAMHMQYGTGAQIDMHLQVWAKPREPTSSADHRP